MHPVSSIIRASELHQQDILAEAAHEARCARVAGRQRRPQNGFIAWALPVAIVVALSVIAAAAGADPDTILHAIAGNR